MTFPVVFPVFVTLRGTDKVEDVLARLARTLSLAACYPAACRKGAPCQRHTEAPKPWRP